MTRQSFPTTITMRPLAGTAGTVGAADGSGVTVAGTKLVNSASAPSTGSVKPDRIGGYRPKKIAGPHHEWLIQRCQKDFTVRGLVAELAERGLKVDYRTMWEFVHAEKLSYKKRR